MRSTGVEILHVCITFFSLQKMNRKIREGIVVACRVHGIVLFVRGRNLYLHRRFFFYFSHKLATLLNCNLFLAQHEIENCAVLLLKLNPPSPLSLSLSQTMRASRQSARSRVLSLKIVFNLLKRSSQSLCIILWLPWLVVSSTPACSLYRRVVRTT